MSLAPPSLIGALDNRNVARIGDSRTNLQTVIAANLASGFQASDWFSVANALMGHPFRTVYTGGLSGKRTDEFINTNGAACLAANAGTVIMGPLAVNDLSQASATPYTNTNGVSVTLSNVALMAATNAQTFALQPIAAGRRVILVGEPGSTSLTAAQVGAMHEFNQRLRDFCDTTPGCAYFDPTPTLWSPTASSTLIGFRNGYSSDGTHNIALGGFAMGQAFVAWLNGGVPLNDNAVASINDTPAVNARSLLTNGLFNTLTGGSISGPTVTGSVPSGWALNGPGGYSIVITSTANANGFGNDISLAITANAAGTVNLNQGPGGTGWSLGDYIQGGIEASVAAGSSHAAVYAELDLNTDNGTNSTYDLYANTDGPTTAYTVKLQTGTATTKAGAISKGYVALNAMIAFSAAGSATVTFRRAWMRRRFTPG